MPRPYEYADLGRFGGIPRLGSRRDPPEAGSHASAVRSPTFATRLEEPMNVRLLFSVLALAVLGAGWVAGAGAGASYPMRSQPASAQAAGPTRPELDMFSTKPRLGVRAITDIGLRIPATPAEAAKVTLYVPAGYGFDIAAAPGTSEGHVAMQTASDFGFGELKAANPANYVNTPQ